MRPVHSVSVLNGEVAARVCRGWRSRTAARHFLRLTGLALLVAVVGQASLAGTQLSSRTVSLAEFHVPTEEPLVLTTNSVVIGLARVAFGPMAASGLVLLVEDIDAEPVVTPLPIPEGVLPVGHSLDLGNVLMVRLSATRALVAHTGPDGLEGSGDEGVLLLDDLGGANTVVPILIGRMVSPHLVRIDERTAATMDGDHGAVLLSDLGGTNKVSSLATWKPLLAFSPTRFLAAGESGYSLVRLEATGPELVPLPGDLDWQTAVPLTARRVLLRESGGVRLVEDVEAAGDNELIALSGVLELVRTGPDRALVHLLGDDATPGTADDAVAMLEDLGGRNRAKVVRVPGAHSAPVALGSRAAVVRVGGGNPAFAPGVALIRGAFSFSVPLETRSRPLALSPTRFLIASEGSTPFETPEDEVMNVFTLRRKPRAAATVVPFAQAPASAPNGPRLLGNGRAVQNEAFLEEVLGPDSVARLRILDGLPGGVQLEEVELRAGGPDVTLQAHFALPDSKLFGLADLTVRIGDVLQRIPAEAIRSTPRGFRYRDPNGEHGFFRLVEYDEGRKRLRVAGRSTGPSAPLGTNLVVSLESTEFYVASAALEAAE